MNPLLTPSQMRSMEATFMAVTGMPSIDLMERAATGILKRILQLVPDGRTVIFLCGCGGNGGDGYAAARLYAQTGGRSIVLSLFPESQLRGDALINYRRILSSPNVALAEPKDISCLPVPALWVDAVFGTGFSRSLDSSCQELFAKVEASRKSGVPVLAVDIPSGVDGLSGIASPGALHATHTITFQCAKTGHFLMDGLDYTGNLLIHSLQIPDSFLPEGAVMHVSVQDALDALPERPRNSHKGTFGHLLLVAGSRGMAGACIMAAQSALRSGVGLVTVALPESLVPILQTAVPCAMVYPLPEENGALSGDAASGLQEALHGKQAFVVGPGLSRRTHPDILKVCLDSQLPGVFDADALNLLSENPDLFSLVGKDHILTPHPGEAARLLASEENVNPFTDVFTASRLLTRSGCTVIYKGAGTLIRNKDHICLRSNGCSGMAKGGSGDVLSGILGALLARGLEPEQAAWIGAVLHAHAGELCAEKFGNTAMTPWDMIQTLPQVWGDIPS